MTDGESTTAAFAALPESWRVWSDEGDGRAVLVFRPDVFDGADYPAECLPTIYVSRRPPEEPMRRPGSASEGWYVAFTLEPEIHVRDLEGQYETRADAADGAVDAARAFADGEVDVHDVYQVPRETYLDALDDLLG
ncbi:DUF5820 family protein [Halospeciosus flavus]|uniref:DUF5820 family protein n=2 Tax=Halospeciosus flavus TaxID=3032283 RepID=A0ABD5Z1M7_9EURY|nr:DUF5820 family protein [Halospeciosus flavus]